MKEYKAGWVWNELSHYIVYCFGMLLIALLALGVSWFINEERYKSFLKNKDSVNDKNV